MPCKTSTGEKKIQIQTTAEKTRQERIKDKITLQTNTIYITQSSYKTKSNANGWSFPCTFPQEKKS